MDDDVSVDFGEDGLVPAVAQDADSGKVLMLAYVSPEALERTRETGRAHYYYPGAGRNSGRRGDERPRPGRRGGPGRLRRRHPPLSGRPGGWRVPHRPPILLLPNER